MGVDSRFAFVGHACGDGTAQGAGQNGLEELRIKAPADIIDTDDGVGLDEALGERFIERADTASALGQQGAGWLPINRSSQVEEKAFAGLGVICLDDD